MRSSKLTRILSGIHRPRVGVDTGHRQRLEDELLSRHRILYARKGWTMYLNPRFPAGRLVTAALAVAVLGIAACTIPTSVEQEVGKTLRIALPPGSHDAPEAAALVEAVEASGLASDVLVNLDENKNGAVGYQLAMWGAAVETDRVVNLLRERFPALERACFSVEELKGTVRTSLAEKIGHAVFSFELDPEHAENFSEQVLMQLREQGFEGHAEVFVDENGEEHVVEIVIEGEMEAPQEIPTEAQQREYELQRAHHEDD
jgi:hypothetical protein